MELCVSILLLVMILESYICKLHPTYSLLSKYVSKCILIMLASSAILL